MEMLWDSAIGGPLLPVPGTVAAPSNAVINSATGLSPGALVLQHRKTSGNLLLGDFHYPLAGAERLRAGLEEKEAAKPWSRHWSHPSRNSSGATDRNCLGI